MHGHLNVKFDIRFALGAISFWPCVNFGRQIAEHSVIFRYNILYNFQLDWQLTLICFKAEYEVFASNLCRWSLNVCRWHWEQRPLGRTMNLHLNPNIQDTLWIPLKFLHSKPSKCRVITSFFWSCTLQHFSKHKLRFVWSLWTSAMQNTGWAICTISDDLSNFMPLQKNVKNNTA